jgi:hypothetical protein
MPRFSPLPFCSHLSTTASSTEVTPIPNPQQKLTPKPIPNGNCTTIHASIDAEALNNSIFDINDDAEEYDFFGNMLNPNPEDNSPHHISTKFISLFILSRKCQKEYLNERKS